MTMSVAAADTATYVDIINAGDDEAMLAFVKESYDGAMLQRLPAGFLAAAHLSSYYGACGEGYDVIQVPEKECGLEAILRNRATGAYVRLSVPPGRTAGQLGGFPKFVTIPVPEGLIPPSRVTDRDIVTRLKDCMDLSSRDEVFAGSVLLARDGLPLFEAAYGQAERSFASPNRLDTKHNIASLGKMFTGVAVSHLAEKGLLNFDDSLSKHLPEGWLAPEVAAQIQIRHLLTHSSGLGDYFKSLYRQHKQELFRNLEDYKILVADAKPAFGPGSRFAYSNTGMLLAGVIVEHVSGIDYFAYLEKHIFGPAGMTDTGAWDKDLVTPNRAIGYSREPTETGVRWWSNMSTRVMRASPSGGIYSTAGDLLRFAIALREHRLLSPESTRTVLTGKAELNAPDTGYGFHLGEDAAGRVARHSGDGRGINAEFAMYLDTGFTTVVLANQDRPAAAMVQQLIRQLLMARQQ